MRALRRPARCGGARARAPVGERRVAGARTPRCSTACSAATRRPARWRRSSRRSGASSCATCRSPRGSPGRRGRGGETFDRLVREHLLVRTPTAASSSPTAIVRDTVYEEIGPAERRRLHGAIAEELARDRRAGAPLDIAELATHVAESADPGDERAVELLLEAGRTVSVTAPLVAAEHYGRRPSCCPPTRRAAARRSPCAPGRCTSDRAPIEAAAAGREALAALQGRGRCGGATVALVVNGLTIAGRVAEALEVDRGRARARAAPGRSRPSASTCSSARGARTKRWRCSRRRWTRSTPAPPPQLIAATHLRSTPATWARWSSSSGCSRLSTVGRVRAARAARHRARDDRLVDRRPGVVGSLEHHLEAARALRPNPAATSIGGHYETALALLHVLRGEWDEALALCRSASFELEQRGAAILAQALHAASARSSPTAARSTRRRRSPARW